MLKLSDSQFDIMTSSLPPALYAYAASDQVMVAVEKIANQEGLRQKMASISLIIGYTLLGFLPLRAILQELSSEVGIDPEKALQLAQDIRREILAPVAHDLAALQPQAEQNYAAAMSETGSAPVQQPAPDTSVQQGPPLPPTPPAPPQSATPPAAS